MKGSRPSRQIVRQLVLPVRTPRIVFTRLPIIQTGGPDRAHVLLRTVDVAELFFALETRNLEHVFSCFLLALREGGDVRCLLSGGWEEGHGHAVVGGEGRVEGGDTPGRSPCRPHMCLQPT